MQVRSMKYRPNINPPVQSAASQVPVWSGSGHAGDSLPRLKISLFPNRCESQQERATSTPGGRRDRERERSKIKTGGSEGTGREWESFEARQIVNHLLPPIFSISIQSLTFIVILICCMPLLNCFYTWTSVQFNAFTYLLLRPGSRVATQIWRLIPEFHRDEVLF